MTGKDKAIQSTMAVNEVAGILETKQIQKIFESECGAETTIIDVSSLWFRPLVSCSSLTLA